MASIEAGRPEKQGAPGSPEKPGPVTSSLASEPRWVFICYSWASEREVERFHEQLEQRLRNRSRSYLVFRDKAREPDKRILAGENYRDVLKARLAEAACCLVVLVPDIFRSDECRLEVEQFRARVDRKEPCFFMPVEFVPVAAEMAEGGHPIAEALRFTNRVDFTGLWNSGPGDPRYEAAVDRIAADIDQNYRKQHGLLLPHEPGDAAAGRLRPGRMVAVLAAVLLAAVGAVALVPPLREAVLSLIGAGPVPVTVDWTARGPLDLFAPAPAYAAAAGAALPEPVPAAPIAAGADGVASVAEGLLDGERWYRVVRDDGSELFLRAAEVSEWRPFAGPLELVLPTPAALMAGGEDVETLGPGTFAPPGDALSVSPDGGWYRIAAAGGSGLVVPAAAAPAWTPLGGDLDLAASLDLRPLPDPAAAPIRRLVPGDALGTPRRGEIAGAGWYRFAEPGGDGFVPEAEAEGRLVGWREVTPQCLVAAVAGSVFAEASAGAARLASFGEGQLVSRGGRLREARVGGAAWYRFDPPEGEAGFVEAAAVCPADCAAPEPCR